MGHMAERERGKWTGAIARRLRQLGSPRASVFFLCGLSLAVVTALIAYGLARSRQQHMGQAMAAIEGLANSYQAYTEKAVNEIDFSLRLVQDYARQLGVAGAPLMQVAGPALELRRLHTPYVSNLIIVNAQGRVVSATHAASTSLGKDATDREYFLAHRSSEQAGMRIGPVFTARWVDTGEKRFSIGRRLSGPRGEFLGAVVAMVDTRMLAEDFARQLDDPSVSVTLIRTDGMVMTRTPYLKDRIGQMLPFFSQFRGEPPARSHYVIRSELDHLRRLIAQRRFEGLPLLIAVTQLEDAAVARWWSIVPLALGVWALATLTTVGMGALVLYLQRGREQAQQESRRSLEVFNEAQRMAHVGSIDHNLLTGEQHWSDEVFRLLEIDPARANLAPELRHERVHADDRERVAHTCGQSRALGLSYQVSYRLQMPDGRVKWISESCSYIRDGATRPQREVITLQDVTNARQAEEELVDLRAAMDARAGRGGRDPFAR